MGGYILIFSLFSLAFSMLAFFSSSVSTSLENGTLAAIAICATLIVGASVVDVVRLNEIEKRLKTLDETEKRIESLRIHSNIAMHMSWGFAHLNNMPFTAFLEFEKAYKFALKAKDLTWIDVSLQCMEEVVRIKKDYEKRINKREIESIKKLKNIVPDDIQKCNGYRAFKKRTEKIYSDLESLKISEK